MSGPSSHHWRVGGARWVPLLSDNNLLSNCYR